MTISVSAFKARCLELLRQVEEGAEPIVLTRRGKIVARVVPPVLRARVEHAWERLRGTGRLRATPGESVLRDEDFDALR